MQKNIITDETIENLEKLSKLKLSADEKEEAKKDLGSILDYMDKLKDVGSILDYMDKRKDAGSILDDMVHPVSNVFREDIVKNGDMRQEILENAPAKAGGYFLVPKTLEQEG